MCAEDVEKRISTLLVLAFRHVSHDYGIGNNSLPCCKGAV